MSNLAITVTQKCEISAGETLKEVLAHTCEAYDVINITVEHAAADMVVDLQPAAGAVSLLAILVPSGVYGTDKISYKVHLDTEGSHNLNNMHLFVGEGACSAFGVALDKLLFSSSEVAIDHVVKILVGRDATP